MPRPYFHLNCQSREGAKAVAHACTSSRRESSNSSPTFGGCLRVSKWVSITYPLNCFLNCCFSAVPQYSRSGCGLLNAIPPYPRFQCWGGVALLPCLCLSYLSLCGFAICFVGKLFNQHLVLREQLLSMWAQIWCIWGWR